MAMKKRVSNMMEIPIGEAMQKVENAIKAYLHKENGEYIIPSVNRIPFYLYGAPGIGKTQGIKKIAKKLGIGFVSFSLTHHTKNSVQGLPTVSDLDGHKYTQFTTPEIIAEVMKAVQMGFPEGVLLLDEFNCSSDTIIPMMLEFLQTRNIGTYKLPDGWIIITAGNPPEYNKNARRFDAAILDRVRMINVIAEYDDFSKYADQKDIHRIIRDCLHQNPDFLYMVNSGNSDSKKQEIVTPRGWENLSWAIKAYEKNGFDIDEELIFEYLKSEKIAHDFYQFYLINTQLFTTSETEDILHGIEHEKYAKKACDKNVTFRMKLIDHFAGKIESEAIDLADKPGGAEMISEMITNAFIFVEYLPEKPLKESLLMKINASAVLMGVLMKVRNDEYLKVCGKAYGMDGTCASA